MSLMDYSTPRSVKTKFKDTGSPSVALRHRAFQVPIWWTWLAGFLLISLSLYATQLLPSLRDKAPPNANEREESQMTITIFSAPSRFEGSVGERQSMAVLSWLSISPDVSVVLFGDHPSLYSFAQAQQPRVSVEPNIDFTFFGRPMFHSMVARARACNSDVAVIIDPDSLLLPDFISVLQLAHAFEHDWLLVSMSATLPVSHFPYHIKSPGQWFDSSDFPVEYEKVVQYIMQHRQWNNCEGGKLWAWNTGELPLHAGVLPPFIYGNGFHDEWLLNEALSSDFRFVLDVSEAISVFRGSNKYSMTSGHMLIDILRVWESKNNAYLAAQYGSFYFRPGNFSSKPVKLLACDGTYHMLNPPSESELQQDTNLQLAVGISHDMGGTDKINKNGNLMTSFRRFFLGKRQNKALLKLDFNKLTLSSTGRSGMWNNMVMGSTKEATRGECIHKSEMEGRILDCPTSRLDFALKPSSTLSLPFSLEYLLQEVSSNEKTVIVSVVGNSYKDMLMSWVCRLRKLKISNFLVIAIDKEVYKFAILQGLPVFLNELAMNISFNDCHFGTKCFQRVTKVKSRIVLKILKLGYDVFFSDVDVYWFKDPLPLLKSFGPRVLVAQSDEYNKTEPLNLPRRLNSGFYFARSDQATIAAFEKIVKHAANSDMSEQPSFYDTLCGLGGSNRVGDNRCLEPDTKLLVHFLDRDKFPNGAYLELWEKPNVKEACEKLGCIVLHNNWVPGRKRKIERQISSGLWEYDTSSRMCLQGWQGVKSMSSY